MNPRSWFLVPRCSALTRRLLIFCLLPAASCLFLPAIASADLGSLKASCSTKDAADNDTSNGLTLPYTFCNDGTPPVGGTTANVGAVSAVAVPEKYAGVTGLPGKSLPADLNSGADSNGEIALDIDVSLPDPNVYPPPAGGYPLIVMMHGCCSGSRTGWEASTIDAGGEKWHYNNAWFASRGYVVLNYTSRGFVDGSGNGSTGQTQLDDRRYEINDFQSLAGQLADDSFFHINPQKVVATGGSYGGGFSWLALTDPIWQSPGGTPMKLAAAAPKYGWTDLVYSLVPNGSHFQTPGNLPATDGTTSTSPLGFPKQSIVAGLYASGKTGVGPNAPHATFPSFVDDAFNCLQSSDPYETNPLCATTLSTTLPGFIANRSAYYQNTYFANLAADPATWEVPLFSAGTFTDKLFPSVEHRRMVERLKATDPSYPVQEYYGDYQHFTQNKAKEWGDVCGADDHVCKLVDYPGAPATPDMNASPSGLKLTGVTTRLNRFIDHYAAPQGDGSQPTPATDVTAALQVCPENAGPTQPLDEPGPRFTAPTFAQLTNGVLHLDMPGAAATSSKVSPNEHAIMADPVKNSLSSSMGGNDGHCPAETTPAGPGVGVYTSNPLTQDQTMIGASTITIDYLADNAQGLQLNSRLYDVFPNGTAVMVDRGMRRVDQASGSVTYQLDGQGWKFPAGHRIQVEVTQDDSPYIKNSSVPSGALLSRVRLDVPVRQTSSNGGGGVDDVNPTADLSAPALASDVSRTTRFKVSWSGHDNAGGTGVASYDVGVRRISGDHNGDWQSLQQAGSGSSLLFHGQVDATYQFRVRARDGAGNLSPYIYADTVVPSSRHSGAERGPWHEETDHAAFRGGLITCSTADCHITDVYRGRDFYLVGRTGSNGGRAKITVDGTSRTVSFYSRQIQQRQVIFHRGFSKVARHHVAIDVLHTRAKVSSGFQVAIDGFGIDRHRPLRH